MSVLRNIPHLQAGRTGNIVVRSMTNAFWEACIQEVNLPGSPRVAAVGTCGIGKTTSTPILIRKLLERGDTVVHCLRTTTRQGWYGELTRVGTKYIARAYPEALPPESIPSLMLSSTYYIVDPGRTTESCDPPASITAKVIIVGSPGDEYWGRARFEDFCGVLKYYPLWSRKELEGAEAILRPGSHESLVQARFPIFGGVPANVFAFDNVARTLIAMKNAAVANLEDADVLEMISGTVRPSFCFAKGGPGGCSDRC
jgi:hypothetical protein